MPNTGRAEIKYQSDQEFIGFYYPDRSIGFSNNTSIEKAKYKIW